MPDAALGHGHRTQKSRVVIGVEPKPEPGTQVFDFGPVKKTGAARYLVGNLGPAQGFFEHLGLVVGTVQDGKVPKLLELWPADRRMASPQALNPRYGALGFVLFVVCIDHAHWLALAQVTPQLFLK